MESNMSRAPSSSLSSSSTPDTVSEVPEKIYHWIDGERPNRRLKILLTTIEHDNTLLCPDEVDTRALRVAVEAMEKVPIQSNKDDVELLADKLLKRYIKIRNGGCFSPKRFLSSDRFAQPGEKPMDHLISNPIIRRLEKALQKYRKIAMEGGWQKIEVPDEPYLYPDKSYPEIPAIKERLKIEGFFTGEIDTNTTYDSQLKEAVIDFQRHHGLKPDGVIGPATLKAMNIPPEKKIDKILLSIERLRWFLQDDPYFVFVNIPGFFLEVFENGESTFHSRVVVGRKKRPTPMMRDEIAYAVLNPYWRAPKTIIAEDILPYLQRGDFQHIRRKGIIATTDYKGREQIDLESVDWSLYTADNIPFFFLQKPGPHNFLGYLKLIFPNRFDVYLHDTNHRNLFKYSYRALSSGCIRVERPIQLYYLLKSKEIQLTYRDIFDIIWSKRTRTIRFRQKVPVYLAYLTVYADKDGTCSFFDDIYGYDKKMESILDLSRRNYQFLTEAENEQKRLSQN